MNEIKERLDRFKKALDKKLDSESFKKSIKRDISKMIREIRKRKIRRIFNK